MRGHLSPIFFALSFHDDMEMVRKKLATEGLRPLFQDWETRASLIAHNGLVTIAVTLPATDRTPMTWYKPSTSPVKIERRLWRLGLEEEDAIAIDRDESMAMAIKLDECFHIGATLVCPEKEVLKDLGLFCLGCLWAGEKAFINKCNWHEIQGPFVASIGPTKVT